MFKRVTDEYVIGNTLFYVMVHITIRMYKNF